MSSDEKNKANRDNSQRSTGPTSPEGKARSSSNALKSGIFSEARGVVSAGERQEDFAATVWRLQRVRRYEAAEIRKQCDTGRARRLLKRLPK